MAVKSKVFIFFNMRKQESILSILKSCEISQEPCDLMKCLNGGQCVVSNNVPSCKCPNDRFIGTRCEIGN